jgi:hypothetical protein
MPRIQGSSICCVEKAMKKLSLKPKKFFERAMEAKTPPRWFNLNKEVKSFLSLKEGSSSREIPRFIVAYAREINLLDDHKTKFSHFPPGVEDARVSSGRFTYFA